MVVVSVDSVVSIWEERSEEKHRAIESDVRRDSMDIN
jgi:hypothetical protein